MKLQREKQFGDGWQRIEHVKNKDGQKIDVWHDDKTDSQNDTIIKDGGEKAEPEKPIEKPSPENVPADGEKNQKLNDWHKELKKDPNIFWHGSPSGDMRGSEYGLHIGTHEAAKQALEARIGVKADGTDWNGTEEYGKTKLAGKKTLKKLDPKGNLETGHNSGNDVPENDYY